MRLKAWLITLIVLHAIAILGLGIVLYQIGDNTDYLRTKIDSRFNELQFKIECS